MNVAILLATTAVINLATPATAEDQRPNIKSAPNAASTAAKPAKPKVPIGVDPGGIPVAFIGPGLDYTQPDIAENLARDGEGELIGFDLITEERKPFAKHDAPADHDTMTSVVNTLLSQAIDIKLQVFKTTNRDTKMIARAVQMAALAKARIIVIWAPPVTGTPPDITRDDAFITAAKTRFPAIAFLAGPVLTQQPNPPPASPDSPPLEPGDALPHDVATKLIKSLRAMEAILRAKPDAHAAELTATLEP
jgi:hypothetical protein